MNYKNLDIEELANRANELLDYTEREIERKQRIIDESREKIRNIINEIKQLRFQQNAIAFLVEGKDFRRSLDRTQFLPGFRHPNGKLKLPEAIFQIVKKEAGPEGLTIGEISQHLETRGINRSSKNWYNIVYTTCIRLSGDKLEKWDKDGSVAFRINKKVQTP